MAHSSSSNVGSSGGSTGSCGGCEEDSPCCFICLSGAEEQPLARPCGCPRYVHAGCLSRWQLQRAGTQEEKSCRFCHMLLPDWRQAHAALPKAVPLMTVVHQGEQHQLAVHPGPEGQREFVEAVRRIYGLGPDEDISLTFSCKVPGGGGEVTLEGPASFDAAVHLASISAGERLRRVAQVKQQMGLAAQAAAEELGMAAGAGTPDGSGGQGALWRRMFSRGH